MCLFILSCWLYILQSLCRRIFLSTDINNILHSHCLMFYSTNYVYFPLVQSIRDITNVLRWVQANASVLGADEKAVVLAGQSAGAHICLCSLVEMASCAILGTFGIAHDKTGAKKVLICDSHNLTIRFFICSHLKSIHPA